ncbi:MAG: DUF4178 domain-containing protein [Candidatus Pacebacteria bacterium]|nr:DUF4178 domain-containing protein [Candidatus Paceibacterota bacterium]
MKDQLNSTEYKHYNELFDLIRSIEPHSVISPGKRHTYEMTDITNGSVLKYGEDEIFLVVNHAQYEEKTKKGLWTWDEFSFQSLITGDIYFVEVEEDDFIEVHKTIEKIRFSDFEPALRIPYVKGIVKDEGSISHDGIEYVYDDDYRATYKNNGEESEVKCYEFRGVRDGKDIYLTIENWSPDEKDPAGSHIEVTLSIPEDPTDYEMIAQAKN